MPEVDAALDALELPRRGQKKKTRSKPLELFRPCSTTEEVPRQGLVILACDQVAELNEFAELGFLRKTFIKSMT
jgi:hypothetical protein